MGNGMYQMRRVCAGAGIFGHHVQIKGSSGQSQGREVLRTQRIFGATAIRRTELTPPYL